MNTTYQNIIDVLNWHLKNSKPVDPNDQSDFFNLTANAIQQLEEIPLPEYKEAKEIVFNWVVSDQNCFHDDRQIVQMMEYFANQKNTQQISDAWDAAIKAAANKSGMHASSVLTLLNVSESKNSVKETYLQSLISK